MAAKQGDGPELTSLQIQDLAEELDITTPIMSYRVVGERVELHLLGGGVAVGRMGEPPPPAKTQLDLSQFTTKQLRKIAARIGIPGTSRLRKSELLAALDDIEPSILAVAMEEAL